MKTPQINLVYGQGIEIMLGEQPCISQQMESKRFQLSTWRSSVISVSKHVFTLPDTITCTKIFGHATMCEKHWT